MKDKIFIDSNVIIYAFGNDRFKKSIAKSLIRQQPFITTQVVNEVINVLIKKFAIPIEEIEVTIDIFKKKMMIMLVTLETIDVALRIQARFHFSYWDSLIVASALENGCKVLYTEDMQHGQIIEDSLTILNPFI